MANRWLRVVAAALGLALSFHGPQFAFLSFISFIPLFSVIDSRSSSAAFKLSYLFGLLFFCFQTYPVAYVTVPGFLVAALYLALYPAVFGVLAAGFFSVRAETGRDFVQNAVKEVFFIPAFWVLLEYARTWILGGMPLALLAYSQWKNLPFIQVADVVGAFGVSYAVMLVNVVLYQGLKLFFAKDTGLPAPIDGRMYRGQALRRLAAVGVGVSLSVFFYGTLSLHLRERADNRPDKRVLRVAVLQGNIPQDQKWDARIKSIIFEKYKRLTFMSMLEKPDLIVWPETAFPGYLEDEPVMAAKLRSVARHSATQMLVGAPTLGDLDRGIRFYNSAVHYSAAGEEIQRYSKNHLVPFGEYVPLEPVLGLIRNFAAIGHFSPGNKKTVFETRAHYQNMNVSAKFSALICYEDMFPGLVRAFCRNGAEFLVNITNDAWFGKTSAPYQHAQASVFRAVENRVNVVRAANTGLSCFISPTGKVLKTVSDKGQEIFVTGNATHELVIGKTGSFYSRFGDVFLLLALALCVWAFRDRAKRNPYSKI